MSLIKLFFTHSSLDPADHDVLQHPALAAMSLRDLADLPMMPQHLGRTIDELCYPCENPLIRPVGHLLPEGKRG